MNHFNIKTILSAMIFFIFAQNAFCMTDSGYICDFGRDLSVDVFFGRAIAMFDYARDAEKDDRYTYVPNNSYSAGAGFSWKRFSFGASLGLPLFKNENASDTKSSDFQFCYYGRKFFAGFFWQDYEGFYVRDNGKDYDRPDIRMVRSGIYGEYVFNSEKHSYKAAFNQSEQQLRSAGSFLLGGGLYYTKIESDHAFDDLKRIMSDKQEVEVWQFGPSVGYGYTWIPKKDFSVTGSLSLGVNVSFNTVNGEKLDLAVFPLAYPKISVGYNNESWGVNFMFLMNMSFSAEVNDENFTFGTGNFRLNYIKRFNTGKRAGKKPDL